MSSLTRANVLTFVLTGVVTACAGDTPDVRVASSIAYEESSSMARGKAHFSEGRYGLALKEFRTTVAAAPMSVEALNALAATYDQIKRFDLAEDYYQRALTQAPQSAQTLNNMGYSYMLQGKFDVASAYLREAKRLDAVNVTVAANLELASPDEVTLEDGTKSAGKIGEIAMAPELLPNESSAPVESTDTAATEFTDSTRITLLGRPDYQNSSSGRITLLAARKSRSTGQGGNRIQVLASRNQAEPGRKQLADNLSVPVRARTTERPGVFQSQEMTITGKQLVTAAAPERQQASIRAVPVAGVATPKLHSDAVEVIAVHAVGSTQTSTANEEKIISIRAVRPRSQQVASAGELNISATLPETATAAVHHQIAMSAPPAPALPVETAMAETFPPLLKPTKVAATVGGAKLAQPVLPSRPEAAVAPAKATVHQALYEVSNGAGRLQMAARIGTYLESAGISVTRLTNARHFRHQTSCIYYKPGQEAEARALAKILPVDVAIMETDYQKADIRLELGGDLLKFDEKLYYGESI